MKTATLLDHYLEERNQLLGTISELLKRDPNVKAAWLWGSIGRGDEDALSDIDLWVIVDDEYIDPILSHPLQYVSQVTNPVLSLEAPQNAPEGGAYLMACYDAPVAPHIVDWYWQPKSLASISDQVRLLFDRAGIRHQEQPIHFSGGPANKAIVERPMHFISFFWMMLMITAKEASRSPWAEKMELVPYLIDPFIKTHQFIGKNRSLPPRDIPSHRLPGEKVQLLYQFADQMSEWMDSIAGQSEEVPALIKPGAYRYLKLIESTIEDKARH
jgi:hypothetical protein